VWGDAGHPSDSGEGVDAVDADDDFVLLMSTYIADAHHQAARLSAEGIDSKIWMPGADLETDPTLKVDLLVSGEDLDDARRLLGLVL
jgi:hypothetical protein